LINRSLQGSNQILSKSLGALQFLVDDSTGGVISCASFDNLQKSPVYVAAKAASDAALAIP
jgi:hypothetical protein